MNIPLIFTICIFVGVYAIISFDLINKAYIALLGAAILIVAKIITPETGWRYVDLNVIVLLISMMVIVTVVKETGLFQYIAIKAAKIARGDPLGVLILLFIVTAFISAFLDNVTTILILSPLSVLIATELGISPAPYLISQAIASNIGGTATLIGDPPNIMIAYGAGLTFNEFAVAMTPLIILILVACVGLSVILFRSTLVVTAERRERIMKFDESKAITDRGFLVKCLVVLACVIGGFLLDSAYLKIGAAIISFAGASVLLIITKSEAEKIFNQIEWTTIFFFAGLFIMVGTLIELKIIDFLGQKLITFSRGNLTMTSLIVIWASGILSGFIDNIPFVATMIPLIKTVNAQMPASIGNVLWWSLSAGACLGGNLTLIGASANVIASGIAAKNGYSLSFWTFTKYGIPYTITSLVITTVYIYVRYL